MILGPALPVAAGRTDRRRRPPETGTFTGIWFTLLEPCSAGSQRARGPLPSGIGRPWAPPPFPREWLNSRHLCLHSSCPLVIVLRSRPPALGPLSTGTNPAWSVCRTGRSRGDWPALFDRPPAASRWRAGPFLCRPAGSGRTTPGSLGSLNVPRRFESPPAEGPRRPPPPVDRVLSCPCPVLRSIVRGHA